MSPFTKDPCVFHVFHVWTKKKLTFNQEYDQESDETSWRVRRQERRPGLPVELSTRLRFFSAFGEWPQCSVEEKRCMRELINV